MPTPPETELCVRWTPHGMEAALRPHPPEAGLGVFAAVVAASLGLPYAPDLGWPLGLALLAAGLVATLAWELRAFLRGRTRALVLEGARLSVEGVGVVELSGCRRALVRDKGLVLFDPRTHAVHTLALGGHSQEAVCWLARQLEAAMGPREGEAEAREARERLAPLLERARGS